MTAKRKAANKAEIVPRGMNLGQVKQLLSFMEEHSLEEFEYSQGDLHIRLKRHAPSNSNNSAPRSYAPPDIVVPGPVPVAAQPGTSASETAAPPLREVGPEPGRAEDQHVVKSPIVGTFYSAPSPGAQPFVKVGDAVENGQVLCIIEAMKLMNEIESDAAGDVMRIFVENGQPVESGEPLFAIRPTHRK